MSSQYCKILPNSTISDLTDCIPLPNPEISPQLLAQPDLQPLQSALQSLQATNHALETDKALMTTTTVVFAVLTGICFVIMSYMASVMVRRYLQLRRLGDESEKLEESHGFEESICRLRMLESGVGPGSSGLGPLIHARFGPSHYGLGPLTYAHFGPGASGPAPLGPDSWGHVPFGPAAFSPGVFGLGPFGPGPGVVSMPSVASGSGKDGVADSPQTDE